MLISPDVLRSHLAYTTWATQRLVGAAAQLSPDELNYDFKTADHSVLGTLVHVYAADRIWLARLNHAPSAPFVSDADYRLSVLQEDWPALYGRWQQWAASLTEQAASANLAYQDTKGNPYSQPVWQVVLHVVNHGTHHRGQVAGFLRTLGRTPPPIDLSVYYREQARLG